MVSVAYSNTRNTQTDDANEIKRFFSLLQRDYLDEDDNTLKPQVMELRALDAMLVGDKAPYSKPRTINGYFTDADKLVSAISRIGEAGGIYMIINPVFPELQARVNNRLNDKNVAGTSDDQIVKRQILFIDADPERKNGITGIPSNDREHQLALDCTDDIESGLSELGWPQPLRMDSGNGSYLIYFVDLPVDDGGLIQRTLAGLASIYDTHEIHIDQTAFNQSRLMRVPGTKNRKGDGLPNRPHRMARIISAPEKIEIVSVECLEMIALHAPVLEQQQQKQPTPIRSNVTPANNSATSGNITASDFAQAHSIQIVSSKPYKGGTRHLLSECPFCKNTDHNACMYDEPSGALGFSCSHNSCRNYQWTDFREHFEPGYKAEQERKKQEYEERQRQKTAPKTTKVVQDKVTQDKDDTSEQKPKEPSALTKLMQITKRARYIATSSGDLYARVPVKSHYEVVSINEHGSGFRRWLVYTYKQMYGIAPNSDALSLCMSGVFADAEYTGEKGKIHVRLAYHKQTNKIYLDMANDDWEVIELSCDGWRVISSKDCPVYFIRPNGVLPLPTPIRGASLHDNLKKIINPKSDKDYILMVGWLLGTLHPKGPYTALNLNGEKGSRKSTTTRIFRSIVDPNIASTRGPQRDGMELAILAQSNHIVALDNLSSFPLWLSDAFCRLCTGSGDGKKKLYTDKDEIIFSVRRPAIINGIDDGLITYADMLDRTILVTLEKPDTYKSEDEVDAQFESLHPKILGSLLTAAAAAMKNQSSVTLELPRMADFARWVTAAEPVLGWEEGTFINAFTDNQESSTSIVVETSPVAIAIVQFMSQRAKWEGSMKDLLDELKHYDVFSQAKTAPKTANKLSGQVKRIISPMKVQDILITPLGRDSHGSKVSIEKVSYTRKTQAGSVDKNEPSVDKKSRSVDKTPSSVDKMPENVDKKSGDLHQIDPDVEPVDSNGRANSVDSVDKMPNSSGYLPKHSEEKREEEEREEIAPDEADILSTLSTSDHIDFSDEDKFRCKKCGIHADDTEEFQFDNNMVGYCGDCWKEVNE